MHKNGVLFTYTYSCHDFALNENLNRSYQTGATFPFLPFPKVPVLWFYLCNALLHLLLSRCLFSLAFPLFDFVSVCCMSHFSYVFLALHYFGWLILAMPMNKHTNYITQLSVLLWYIIQIYRFIDKCSYRNVWSVMTALTNVGLFWHNIRGHYLTPFASWTLFAL